MIDSSLPHVPIMVSEILEFAVPALKEQTNAVYFDGTLGRGGHLKAILENFSQVRAVAVDQDPEAIVYAKDFLEKYHLQERVQVLQANFSDTDKIPEGPYNFILLDLGVSSPQLDQANRGFSFQNDGPLDMRMNLNQDWSATDIIASYTEQELIDLFRDLGEVRSPFRVVRAIVHDRKTVPFTTTKQLAGLIERVDGWRKKGIHPATLYFMALRLKVNSELSVLEQSLPIWMSRLKPKGRIAVLTFHSLEDRIVKTIFRGRKELGFDVNRKVIIASEEEQKTNPRSRSAKLRVFERD